MLHPPGPELAARNRRWIADRQQWPDGAIEACEAIERDWPGWSPVYSPGGLGLPQPGYYAPPAGGRGMQPWLYGATPADLVTAIARHRNAR